MEEYQKTPEKIIVTRLQLRISKLLANGHSRYRVAKILRVPLSVIYKSVDAFEKNYEELIKFVAEVEKTGYFSKKSAKQVVQQRTNEGYHGGGSAPLGYKWNQGKLEIDPNSEQTIRKIFAERFQGKSTGKIAREQGLKRQSVDKICHNPVYAGKLRSGNALVKGLHPALINYEDWKRLQPTTESYHGCPPTGFKKICGKLVVDAAEGEKIRQIFALRADRKTLDEISRTVGIPTTSLLHMLQNKTYVNAIVPIALFTKANRTKRIFSKQREAGSKTRSEIMGCLASNVRTVKGIATRIGKNEGWISDLLGQMRDDGIVEKKPARPFVSGKWYLKHEVENFA